MAHLLVRRRRGSRRRPRPESGSRRSWRSRGSASRRAPRAWRGGRRRAASRAGRARFSSASSASGSKRSTIRRSAAWMPRQARRGAGRGRAPRRRSRLGVGEARAALAQHHRQRVVDGRHELQRVDLGRADHGLGDAGVALLLGAHAQELHQPLGHHPVLAPEGLHPRTGSRAGASGVEAEPAQEAGEAPYRLERRSPPAVGGFMGTTRGRDAGASSGEGRASPTEQRRPVGNGFAPARIGGRISRGGCGPAAEIVIEAGDLPGDVGSAFASGSRIKAEWLVGSRCAALAASPFDMGVATGSRVKGSSKAGAALAGARAFDRRKRAGSAARTGRAGRRPLHAAVGSGLEPRRSRRIDAGWRARGVPRWRPRRRPRLGAAWRSTCTT